MPTHQEIIETLVARAEAAEAEVERLRPFEHVVTSRDERTGWHIMTEDHYREIMACTRPDVCTCACGVEARASGGAR